jgi:hypothetical protein
LEGRYLEPTRPVFSEEEIAATRKVVANLLLVRKNYSLYPEDHSICINVFEQFQRQLETYLQREGRLRLEIKKDELLFQGEVIHSEDAEEGTLSFTLFRDGIRWLEFKDGIDAEEIKEFLRILNKYKFLSEEPEGDLVTAFWESEFSHIKYEVADIFWDADSEMEFTPSHETEETLGASFLEEEGLGTLTEITIGKEAFEISAEEEATILDWIRIEEKRDPTPDFLDALLDSLLENREKENFEIILDTLEAELLDSLSRKDFDVTLKILEGLQYILDTCSTDLPWTVPIIDNFFLTASTSQSLLPLQSTWSDMDPDQGEKVTEILLLLRPEVIHTLGTMLLKTPSLRMQQIVMDVMTKMASRDIRPLESLLGSVSDADLAQKLVHILGTLEGERPPKVLKKMIRHRSSKVRQEALKGLLRREPESMKELFPLIDDESESVHSLILDHLGMSKSRVAEDILLDYLEMEKYKRTDDDHIIACFRALGQCGSPRSIPFLRQVLHRRGWMPRFWKAAQRRGAAIALSVMGINEAQHVLEEASHSLFPSVKRTARQAMENGTR